MDGGKRRCHEQPLVARSGPRTGVALRGLPGADDYLRFIDGDVAKSHEETE